MNIADYPPQEPLSPQPVPERHRSNPRQMPRLHRPLRI